MTLLEALLEQKKHGGDVYYQEEGKTRQVLMEEKWWALREIMSNSWHIDPPKPIPFEEAWKLMVDGKILQDDYGQLWKIKVSPARFVEIQGLINVGGTAPTPRIWVKIDLTDQLPKFVRVLQPGEVV